MYKFSLEKNFRSSASKMKKKKQKVIPQRRSIGYVHHCPCSHQNWNYVLKSFSLCLFVIYLSLYLFFLHYHKLPHCVYLDLICAFELRPFYLLLKFGKRKRSPAAMTEEEEVCRIFEIVCLARTPDEVEFSIHAEQRREEKENTRNMPRAFSRDLEK